MVTQAVKCHFLHKEVTDLSQCELGIYISGMGRRHFCWHLAPLVASPKCNSWSLKDNSYGHAQGALAICWSQIPFL